MLGLVSYESDEEDDNEVQEAPIHIPAPIKPGAASITDNGYLPDAEDQRKVSPPKESIAAEGPGCSKIILPHCLGPSPISRPNTPELPAEQDVPIGPTLPSPNLSSSDSSPFTLTRQQVQTLTLPHTIPSIPPSPPGSPPPLTSSKFSTFLSLKRNGTHFNEKLSRSSALRNPRLLEKLLGFVGFETDISGDSGADESGGSSSWSGDQYVSNLSKDLWDPCTFQSDVFYENLRKKQEQILQKKMLEERSTITFISEKSGGSVGGAATASDGLFRGRRSAAERIMAGLDRERDRDRGGDAKKESNNNSNSNSSIVMINSRDRERRRYNGRSRSNSRHRDEERDRDRDRERDRDRDRDRHSYRR